MAEEEEEVGGEEGGSEWLGQGFALLLVCALIGLVVWFARGYDANPDVGFVGDAGADDATAAHDATAALGDAVVAEEELVEGPAANENGLDTALFGALVTSSEGTPLSLEQGCVLRVTLTPAPTIARVRLDCEGYRYESATFDRAIGVVQEAVSPAGPIYTVQITTPQNEEDRRISVDTDGERMLLLDGEGRAELVVDQWSAPRPTEPYDVSSPGGERPPFDPEGCTVERRWMGSVLLAEQELEPLTVSFPEGVGIDVDLFDARAGTIDTHHTSCRDGVFTMSGSSARYDGVLGPHGRSVVGNATFDGEPALFWLVAVPAPATE